MAFATNLPWGMSFPNGIEPTLVRVHPTPLYELAAGLADRRGGSGARGSKPRPTGAILGEYLMSHRNSSLFWLNLSAAIPRF